MRKAENNEHKKILITDGGAVNTLGIVRHLGKSGNFKIYILGYNRLALSRFSKYCHDFFLVSHPKKNANAFLEHVLQIVDDEKIDFIMPVGFYAHKIFIKNKELLSHRTKFFLPNQQSFETASSKIDTTALAEKIGVLVPKTWTIQHPDELNQLNPSSFPIVIKSQKEIGGRMIEYAYSKKELNSKFLNLVETHQLSADNYPILQEYIEGNGVGYFAYYQNGQMKAQFMHERIREFPVSGGRSVCARSIFDLELQKSGKAMLDALQWNGCAMVEFKRTKNNKFYLLEINPKLWGSIELAIVCGANFPLMMIEDAFASGMERSKEYEIGKSFQWILNGELYYFFNRPLHFFRIFKTAFKSKKDFWFSDIKPNLMQTLFIVIDLYKVILHKIRKW